MKVKPFSLFDGRNHAAPDEPERDARAGEETLETAETEVRTDASDAERLADVEHEIREFVRNDVAYLRRPAGFAGSGDAASEAAVTKVNFLIQRVAGASLAEIDGLIEELDQLRETLHLEGQRVQRELANYAQLSQAAMKSTRMIAENMTNWRNALPPSPEAQSFDRS